MGASVKDSPTLPFSEELSIVGASVKGSPTIPLSEEL
jgi:hypothetical protein